LVYFTQVPGSQVQRFEESDSASFLFWGLVTIRDPKPGEKIGRYLGGKRKISIFKVTTQTTFFDGLFSVITLGIYSSRTVIYSGDVVE
jgi:hypothetical protein